MEQFLYHFKPPEMTGDLLMPLNELRETLPETFAAQAKKYAGREALMQKRIPLLGCLGNDVLHFSPIHPQRILETWRAEGLSERVGVKTPFDVYRVPVSLISAATAVTFQSFNFKFGAFDPALDKYAPFAPRRHREQEKVSPEQIDIWRADIEAGRRPFWYSHTMHVLAKQRIDTRRCELVTCR